MIYTLLSTMLMKIKEKDVGRELNKKWHVAVVAY
jgi:hypothetical protein